MSDSYFKVTRLDADPCRCGVRHRAKFGCRCGLVICTACEESHYTRCEAAAGKIADLYNRLIEVEKDRNLLLKLWESADKLAQENADEGERLIRERDEARAEAREQGEAKEAAYQRLYKTTADEGGVEVSVVCRVCGFRPCRYRCRKPSEEVEREKDTAELECDCQNPEPETGVAGVSNHCPVHNLNPLPDS